jgi:hypothetical protein
MDPANEPNLRGSQGFALWIQSPLQLTGKSYIIRPHFRFGLHVPEHRPDRLRLAL